MADRALKLIGRRFNHLVVLARLGVNKHRQATWQCKCDCGGQKIATSQHLTSGDVTSCGCSLGRRSQAAAVSLPEGEADFNHILRKYKRGAMGRGLAFTLIPEQFRQLTSANCFYCGAKPQMKEAHYGVNGTYRHNGIDRIDNDLGYELHNCVACCEECNWLKGTMTQTAFLDAVLRIAKHQDNTLVLSGP